jgi:hypothetical protein
MSPMLVLPVLVILWSAAVVCAVLAVAFLVRLILEVFGQ